MSSRETTWQRIHIVLPCVTDDWSIYDAANALVTELADVRKRAAEADELRQRIAIATRYLSGGPKPDYPPKSCEVVDELVGMLTSAELRIEP